MSTNPIALIECFDFYTMRWEVAGNLERPRISPGAVAVGGKIYILGGYSSQEPGKNHLV
jgi:Kelch motif